MPVINFVQVSTFLQASPAAPLNYLPIAAIPVDNGDAPFSGTTATYSSTAAMLEAGFLSTDAAVLSAGQVFGQGAFTTTIPTRVVVIKRATPVAQVTTIQVVASDDGDYKLFISLIGGTAVEAATFTASTNTVTEIRDGLLSSLAGGAFASTVTGASVSTDSATVTADTAGAPFVLTATGPNGAADITVTSTTANVGLYDDLDAAFPLANFWAVLPDPSEAVGTVLEASRWAEASAGQFSTRRNVTMLQTADTDILSATTPNFASDLVALSRTRTFPLLHSNTTDKMNAAWFGRFGAGFPGSRAWHFGVLGGTTETTNINYTQTQGDNIKAARCSWIEREGPASTADVLAFWGQGSGGNFVVQKQAEDYYWLRVGAELTATMKSSEGVNMSADGTDKLKAAVNVVLTELGTTDPPVIDLERTTVTAVSIDDIPASEVEVGDYLTNGGIQVDTVLIPKLRSVANSTVFALS